MAERKWFRVGYFVYVDVYSYHESEASVVGLCATNWPTNITFSEPVDHQGIINSKPAHAKIILASNLMTKKSPVQWDPPHDSLP